MDTANTTESAVRYVSVVMERARVASRWAGERWSATAAVCDGLQAEGEPRVIVEQDGLRQVLFPGCRISLNPKEAEGYLLNVSSPEPRIFILWRMEGDLARPVLLSVSYHEGARWMDSEESVDSVPLPEELRAWVAAYGQAHYKPEPKKPKRYASSRERNDKGRF